MFQSCTRCFGRLGIGEGGGDELMWQLDLKPHVSGEFSIALVQANASLEDQGQVLTSPLGTYVGVYDGHGGPEASHFVNNRLFNHLQSSAMAQGGMSEEAIKRAFRETEEEFLLLARRSWTTNPQMAAVGSCCLVGFLTGDLLYVANLGDSRAVLGRRDSSGRDVVAERLSTDHNVAEEEIRREVKDLHPEDSHIVVYTRGVWRIKGIIQVSRSIGDMYLKKPEFSRDPTFQQVVCPVPINRAVISSEPSITIRKLRQEDLFVIFASDGLWEQLSDKAAVEIVTKNPRAGIAKTLAKAAVTEAAKKREMRYQDMTRLEKGIRRHFHDDITVIVLYLDHGTPGGSSGLQNHNLHSSTNAPSDIFSFNSSGSSNQMSSVN